MSISRLVEQLEASQRQLMLSATHIAQLCLQHGACEMTDAASLLQLDEQRLAALPPELQAALRRHRELVELAGDQEVKAVDALAARGLRPRKIARLLGIEVDRAREILDT